MRKIWIFLGALLFIAVDTAAFFILREVFRDEIEAITAGIFRSARSPANVCRGDADTPGEALAACTRLLEEPGLAAPDKATYHLWRGNVHLRLRQFSRALADYERALEFLPKYEAAHYGRGLVYGEMGEFKLALEAYTRAVEADPGYVPAYINRANIHRRLADEVSAIADYDKAIALSPDAPVAYVNRSLANRALKYFDRALADANRAVVLAPRYGEGYRARGLAHHELGQYEKAIADFDQALAFDPHRTSVYANRAASFERLGQREKALEDWGQAIAADPRYVPYLMARARQLMQLERWRAAAEELTGVLQLSTDNPHALRLRAQAYENLGQRENAIADHRAILRFNPLERASQDALRRLNAPTGTPAGDNCENPRHPPNDRMTDCTRVIDNPATPPAKRAAALVVRAGLHVVTNALPEAIADADAAIKLDPRLAEAYLHRGLARMRRDQNEHAVADFDRAEALDPQKSEQARLYRSYARVKLKQYKEALADLDRLVMQSPSVVAVWHMRGLAHEKLGNREQAIRDYREALRLFPQFRDANDGLKRLGG